MRPHGSIPRPRPLEPIEDDHSASRRVDVLELEAPHLIAPAGRTAESVRELAGTLRLAIDTGRRELAERGGVRDELWTLMDRLSGELEQRLGDLELERRLGGAA